MKALSQLRQMMTSTESFKYDYYAKQRFNRTGRRAMKEMAENLGLSPFEVSFNPGGQAVSGDLTLIGMFNEKVGIYVSMNKDFPVLSSGQVLVRSVRHMKDWSGGSNGFVRFEDLDKPDVFLAIKERILR